MAKQTYIALLRGINVSGSKKIKMAIFRAQLSELGFENVRTYIQSGNVVFESEQTENGELEQQIQNEIRRIYGYEVPTMVFTKEEFETVQPQSPFLEKVETEIKSLHVTFIRDTPTPEQIEKLKTKRKGEEDFKVIDKTVYLYCPYGSARTKLSNNQIETTFKTKATTRNWRTISKLNSMIS